MTHIHLGGEDATENQRDRFKQILRAELGDAATLHTVAETSFGKQHVEARGHTAEARSWMQRAEEIAPCVWSEVKRGRGV